MQSTSFSFVECVCVRCVSCLPRAGAEGNVDESLQLMKEVEEVKLKKKQAEDEFHGLIPRHAVQQQKLKACEVSFITAQSVLISKVDSTLKKTVHVHVYSMLHSSLAFVLAGYVYRRTGFDCEYLLNANCEFFHDSQSFNTQS